MLEICGGDRQCLVEVENFGVVGRLVDLAQNGTERGKRKATLLLELMNISMEQGGHK